MSSTTYLGRRARALENDEIRVTVLEEGGHIAEIFHKGAGVNPFWTPPWPSIEPSEFDRVPPPDYGTDVDARLLAGIMGHNLCLDLFGPPSPEEAKAGLSAHGEGSVVPYTLSNDGNSLVARARFPIANLDFERVIELRGGGLAIRETLQNRSASNRAIGWTQHVTVGPPFLERGRTEFRASATRSKVFESQFGADDYLVAGAEFDWPLAPGTDGRTHDLRVSTSAPRSSAFTAHLMDPARETAFFVAFSPSFELAFGYVWRTADFPWLGIWEENHSRTHAPWNGRTLTRGLEFGVSPIPETREAMVKRGRLFGVPTFRRLPAGGTVRVAYEVVLQRCRSVPEVLDGPGAAFSG